MARFAPAALIGALLVATAAFFAYTESLKLTLSPILGTQVTKVFSPTCRCVNDRATISFRLRHADRVTIDVVAGRSRVVRELVTGKRYPRGTVSASWNGRDDAGQVVPDGTYKPRVHLAAQRRTILLPNPIAVDTKPPAFVSQSAAPRVFSPDGDGRRDRVIVGYSLDQPAFVTLLVDGRVAVVKRGLERAGKLDWFGRVDGHRVGPGRYVLRLVARDLVGNRSRPTQGMVVVARFVELRPARVVAAPGAQLSFVVVSDAARVRWRLGSRSGVAAPGRLRVRAPLQPGLFTLVVTANGHDARAGVLVRRSGG